MKTIKDLVEKYPSILNMRLSGLEFLDVEATEGEIKNLIEGFTEVDYERIERWMIDFLLISAKYKPVSIKDITDKKLVNLKVKDGVLYVNDKYNNYKRKSSNIKDVYNELLYLVGIFQGVDDEIDLWWTSFNDVANFINDLEVRD